MAKKQQIKKPVKKPRKSDAKPPELKEKPGRNKIDVDELRVKIFYEAPKGLNDGALSKFLGISEAKFYELKKENVDFLDSIKFYRKVTVLEVLKSFTKVACGFSYDETTSELKKDKATGEMKMVATKVVTKMVVPSATAGYQFLKNQMPEEFKDKIEATHTLHPSVLENITFVIKGKS